MSRPPIKQNLRKVYPRRKQFRTLLPSPTVPGPRRTRSSAGGLRHLTLRDRITPLSADLVAHGHTRALALKKLRRICQAEVRRLKERLTPATVKLYLFKPRERRKDRRKKWQQGYYRTNREKIGAYAVGSISSRLPKDAGGNILPTGPPFLGRRSPIMTRRRSTFLAGQPADPDELQVEFDRRVARLLIASSANFIPISAAGFVCVWSLFARAGSRIVAVRHRINHPYEHPLSKSPRKPTQTATTRQACQAS